jgi:hypothetical protein
MRSPVRLPLGLALLACGAFVGLYGLFALFYNGDCRSDCGSSIDVTRLGYRMNADHVGWVALAIALVVILAGTWLLVRRGFRAADS